MATSSERVRRHRERQRDKGLRLVQVWIPDTRNPEVRERIRRDCLALRAHEQEALDNAFVSSHAKEILFGPDAAPYEGLIDE